MAKYKILKQKADCVLLSIMHNRYDIKYIVKDIEGDIIYMSLNNLNGAEEAFASYDLNKVRETKQAEFRKWLSEYAEA